MCFSLQGTLPQDLPFIFKVHHKHRNKERPECGSYNTNAKTWVTTNIRTEYRIFDHHSHLVICYTSHLTHFGAIVGKVITTQMSAISLDSVSILGSSLSLFGLICIWLTAICFRSWREKPSNKVLLNISLVLTLINLLFLVLNLPKPLNKIIDMKNFIHCMTMGMFLHYIVLVLFMWMLIIAVMLYQRYAVVIGYKTPSQYITKYGLLAWGLPLIPTICVAYFEPKTYMTSVEQQLDNTGICYPSGKSLYFGVILPIAMIVLANLGIFICILYSMHKTLSMFKREAKDIKNQVRLSILLFFLLGISWIFGLLSHFDTSPVLSYCFCITATLQGFVLFIYFIVIDDSTRFSWLGYCCMKSYYPNEQRSMKLIYERHD